MKFPDRWKIQTTSKKIILGYPHLPPLYGICLNSAVGLSYVIYGQEQWQVVAEGIKD